MIVGRSALRPSFAGGGSALCADALKSPRTAQTQKLRRSCCGRLKAPSFGVRRSAPLWMLLIGGAMRRCECCDWCSQTGIQSGAERRTPSQRFCFWWVCAARGRFPLARAASRSKASAHRRTTKSTTHRSPQSRSPQQKRPLAGPFLSCRCVAKIRLCRAPGAGRGPGHAWSAAGQRRRGRRSRSSRAGRARIRRTWPA